MEGIAKVVTFVVLIIIQCSQIINPEITVYTFYTD